MDIFDYVIQKVRKKLTIKNALKITASCILPSYIGVAVCFLI